MLGPHRPRDWRAVVKVLYFAWLRTKAGVASEEISPPPEIDTVGALMDWIAARKPGFAEAMAMPGVIRAAVNQEFAQATDVVRAGDEVAFFPPITGG